MSTLIGNYTMGYDGDGQLTQQTDHGTLSVYAYDQLGQLTSGGGTAQTYDVNGNRTGDTVTAGNEVTYDGSYTYGYDQEGNETVMYNAGVSTTWAYDYDTGNQMTYAQTQVNGTVVMEVDYTYDAFGNMIKEVELNLTTSPITTTAVEFVEDGWNPAKSGATGQSGWNVVADLNAGGTLATHYVWGDDVDQLFGRYDAGGTLTTDPAGIYATMNDPNGSVRDIVSGSGTLIASVPYDAFGNMLTVTSPGGAVLDPQDYVGRYTYDTYDFDAATKLYDVRDRVYDAATGRWLSQDPMGFDAGDSNLYRYVNNRPTEATDPSGYFADPPPGQAGKYGPNGPTVRDLEKEYGLPRGGTEFEVSDFWENGPSGKADEKIRPAAFDDDVGDPIRIALSAYNMSARSYMIWAGVEKANTVLMIAGIGRVGAQAVTVERIRGKFSRLAPPETRAEVVKQFLFRLGVEKATQTVRDAAFGSAVIGVYLASLAASNKQEAWEAFEKSSELIAKTYVAMGHPSGFITFDNAIGGQILKTQWKSDEKGTLNVQTKRWGLGHALGLLEW